VLLEVNVGHNLMYGPQAAFFAELFGTRVRYSGVSIVYQVTGVFAGGLAPLIATVLLEASDGGYRLVAAYVAGVSLLTCVAAYLAPDTRGQDLAIDPSTRSTVTTPPALRGDLGDNRGLTTRGGRSTRKDASGATQSKERQMEIAILLFDGITALDHPRACAQRGRLARHARR